MTNRETISSCKNNLNFGEDKNFISEKKPITNIEKINYILFPPYISAKNIICDFINSNGHKNKN